MPSQVLFRQLAKSCYIFHLRLVISVNDIFAAGYLTLANFVLSSGKSRYKTSRTEILLNDVAKIILVCSGKSY